MVGKRVYHRRDGLIGGGVILGCLLVLGAVGHSGRQRSWTLVCQLNLKRLGGVLLEYTEDHHGQFPTRGGPDGMGRWIYATDYPEQLRLCPVANKSALEGTSGNWWGSTTEHWVIPTGDAGGGREPGSYGSYGINAWCYVPYDDDFPWFGKSSWLWETPLVDQASHVPMLLDAVFFMGFPLETTSPPEQPNQGGLISDDIAMQRFCIDRHQGAINATFMDGAVRTVGLKELWTLKWHRKYNTAGPWTIAGGVDSTDWPEWMRAFKDY